MMKESIQTLCAQTHKPQQDCEQALLETGCVERAKAQLFAPEIAQIKQRVIERNEEKIIAALVSANGHLDSAVSLLNYGYDVYNIVHART